MLGSSGRPVYRPLAQRAIAKPGFVVELRGASIGRLAETIRMFLAIHRAGLPITIADPEEVRLRLLGLDAVGIVPRYDSLHRAAEHFPRDLHVHETPDFDDLGRSKRKAERFITWEPLPVPKPREF